MDQSEQEIIERLKSKQKPKLENHLSNEVYGDAIQEIRAVYATHASGVQSAGKEHRIVAVNIVGDQWEGWANIIVEPSGWCIGMVRPEVAAEVKKALSTPASTSEPCDNGQSNTAIPGDPIQGEGYCTFGVMELPYRIANRYPNGAPTVTFEDDLGRHTGYVSVAKASRPTPGDSFGGLGISYGSLENFEAKRIRNEQLSRERKTESGEWVNAPDWNPIAQAERRAAAGPSPLSITGILREYYRRIGHGEMSEETLARQVEMRRVVELILEIAGVRPAGQGAGK